MVFLAYQILSQHTQAFRRWASLKAYVIINGMEIVFWAAVVFLTIQAAIQKCVAPTCFLSWGIAALGANMRYFSSLGQNHKFQLTLATAFSWLTRRW